LGNENTAKLFTPARCYLLIDKGVISESELRERLEQAHEVASLCPGGSGGYAELL
jgi:hypothetical protein